MPDQTPEPLTDDELRELAARDPRHAESYAEAAAIDAAGELLVARTRIEELAAQRNPDDEVLVEGSWFHPDDLPKILGNYMRRCDEYGREAKEGGTALVEARDWAAWFAAARDYWWSEATAVRRECDDARARITELEAGHNPAECFHCSRCADADDSQQAALRARIAELEAYVADRLSPTTVATARAELESPAVEPHAYIAVKRYRSINADRPEWQDGGVIIPAGDPHGVQDWYEQNGYDLVPIVGTETSTRPVATPQSDPVGYAVVSELRDGTMAVYRPA